jgi:multidrug efflux pump
MVISLTTTPAMCGHLLKSSQSDEKHGFAYRASEKFFDGSLSVYRRSLRWALDHSALMLVVLTFTIALNVVLIVKIPKGFFPMQDTGVLVGGVQGPQDASFPFMDYSLQEMEKVIKADPAVDYVNAYTGGGRGATNGGTLFISLRPLSERKGSAMEVIGRIRSKISRLPIASAFFQPVQDLRIGGRSSNALYQYTLQADSFADLAHWGPVLLAKMKKMPMLQDVNSDQQNGGLEEMLTYDRVTAARLGQTAQSLNNALYSAFGQSQVSVIYTQMNQYYVVLEVAPQYWQSPAGLNNIYLKPGNSITTRAAANIMTPLAAVTTHQTRTTPLQVNHTGVFPSVTISFNLAPGVALSDATAAILQIEGQLSVPSTIHGFFSGTLEAYQQSLSSEPILIITALAAVYIVLGVLYESLIHPLTIISTLPSASVGAMVALMLFHMDLNVMSIIGIVLLIGIVKKNAIMMIDFALAAEREGRNTADAIFEACMLRFRPIMMTTMAAIFGSLPLAFGTGMGSELRRPLGITIVGGLMLSQLITLYTTPVVYLAFDRLRLRFRGVRHETFTPRIEGVTP